MGRQRGYRRVGFQPNFIYFQPQGVHNPGEITLKVEEMESIRLKDYLKMDQEEAAKKMGVSQPTFHRIVSDTHRKIAQALVEGKAIKIEGGDYVITMPKAKVPVPPTPAMPPPIWRGRHGGGPPPSSWR